MFARIHPTRNPTGTWAALALLVLGGVNVAEAQVVVEPPPIRDVPRHIRSISPRMGPVGTEVRVWTDGLPPNSRMHVGIGELQGCGYEVRCAAQTNAKGELSAIVEVPDWGHWTHYEVVTVFDEDYRPIASSDAFHIVNEAGWVQREGVIASAWHGCPALEGADGVTYALVGQHALSLGASVGHALVLEGPIVPEGACSLQNAIDVQRIEMVPSEP